MAGSRHMRTQPGELKTYVATQPATPRSRDPFSCPSLKDFCTQVSTPPYQCNAWGNFAGCAPSLPLTVPRAYGAVFDGYLSCSAIEAKRSPGIQFPGSMLPRFVLESRHFHFFCLAPASPRLRTALSPPP
jgi:hypothetical protein